MRIDPLNPNKPCGVRRLVAAFAAPSGDKSPHSKKERRAALIPDAVTGKIHIESMSTTTEASHEN